jgi:N-acetylneuraminate synthase
MSSEQRVNIGGREVSGDAPVFFVAEIGINHNGSLDLAKQLIDAAAASGCDAIKFQKRNPELCVPPEQRDIPRETPWGLMSYIEYRHKIELGVDEFRAIDEHCRNLGIQWFLSVWDIDSLEFALKFSTPALKIPSALLTNRKLVASAFATGLPVILSTGMSTQEQVDEAVTGLPVDRTIICHCISTYPAKDAELNLRVIQSYQKRYPYVIGYSGHETGLSTTIAAMVLGAKFIERHISLDRAMWGTDQAASLEPGGLKRLVRDIRAIESAMGDGHKMLMPSELPSLKKLRRE